MNEYGNSYSLALWEGALEGCQEEIHNLEKAVGMELGESRISSRLRQFAALLNRAKQQEQRIRELESWIPKAYKEGYQDAQNDESEGFDDDWMVSMAKMVFDEKLEPPQPFRPNPQCQSPDNCRSAGFCDDAWRCSSYPEPEQTQ